MGFGAMSFSGSTFQEDGNSLRLSKTQRIVEFIDRSERGFHLIHLPFQPRDGVIRIAICLGWPSETFLSRKKALDQLDRDASDKIGCEVWLAIR